MKAVRNTFRMFSQTIVKFFLKAIFFLSVCILCPKRHFQCSIPVSESLVIMRLSFIVVQFHLSYVKAAVKVNADAKPFLPRLD